MSKNASCHRNWVEQQQKNLSKHLSNKNSFWDLIVRSEETQHSSLLTVGVGCLPAARIFFATEE